MPDTSPQAPMPARPAPRPAAAGGWRGPALLAAATALAYAPACAGEYAFSDDWNMLDAAQRGAPDIVRWMIASGRPVLAVITDAGFRLAGGVAGLAGLRAVAVLGLALLAVALARHLSRNGWAPVEAAPVALLVVALPPMRVYAAWACAFPYPWALLAAHGAYRVLEPGLEPGGWPRAGRLIGAVGLLTVAVLTYQPAAAFFWVPLAVSALGPRARAFGPRPLLACAAVFGASGVLGLAAAKVGSRVFPLLPPERAGLALDPLAKAAWFVRGPLVDALNVGTLNHWYPLAALVLVLGAVGLALDLRRAGLPRGRGLALAAALLPLSLSPNLLVRESATSYRIEVALAALCALVAAHAVRGLAARFSPAPGRVVPAALAAGALAALVAAGVSVQRYVARPQATELAWLRAALPREPAGIERVRVIAATRADSLAPAVRYDEFGVPSFSKPWVPAAAVAVMLRERGAALPVEVLGAGARPADAPGVLTLDAGRIGRGAAPR